MKYALESIAHFLTKQELRTSLLLVLANKQDLPVEQGRISPAQVSEALGLTSLRERKSECTASQGATLTFDRRVANHGLFGIDRLGLVRGCESWNFGRYSILMR